MSWLFYNSVASTSSDEAQVEDIKKGSRGSLWFYMMW